MWVEAVCPYLSLTDMQLFRLCSQVCRSLIRHSLPVSIALLQAQKVSLENSPIGEQEEADYRAMLSLHSATITQGREDMNCIDPSNITVLRTMKSLAPAVLATLKVMNVLLGFEPADNPVKRWGSDFLRHLKSYDVTTLTAKQRRQLGKFLEEWSAEAVAKASNACLNVYHLLQAVWVATQPAPPRPLGAVYRLERLLAAYQRLATK